MKWLGWAISICALGVVGRGWIESSVGLTMAGLALFYLGVNVTSWTIRGIGDERIVIEPSPVPGFNAYFEQRGVTGWHRELNITGWGETQERAERSCRERVVEWRENTRRLQNTPTKVIDL